MKALSAVLVLMFAVCSSIVIADVITEPYAQQHFILGHEIRVAYTINLPPGDNIYFENVKVYFKRLYDETWVQVGMCEYDSWDCTQTLTVGENAWDFLQDGDAFQIAMAATWLDTDSPDQEIIVYTPADPNVVLYADFDHPSITSVSNGGDWATGDIATVNWSMDPSSRIEYFSIEGSRADNTDIDLTGPISANARTYSWRLQDDALGVVRVRVKCFWSAETPNITSSPSVPVNIEAGWPTISGRVTTSLNGVSYGLPNVEIVANSTVVTITDEDGNYVFETPTEVWSGTVVPRKSFYDFAPTSRSYLNNDHSRYSQNFSAYYHIQFESLSWETDGNGFNFWALCPADDFVGSPAITLEVDFLDEAMSTAIPAGNLMLEMARDITNRFDVLSTNDVTSTNGYVAHFTFPHPCLPPDIDCGYLTSKIATFQDVSIGGEPGWRGSSLPEAGVGRVSQLDLNPNGIIGLDDASLFVQTYYKCSHQAGYNSCANFVGDAECVDVSDLSVLSAHYGHTHDKSGVTKPAENEIAFDLKLEPTTVSSRNSVEVSFDMLNVAWSVGYARLRIDGGAIDRDFRWIPTNDANFPVVLVADPASDGSEYNLVALNLGSLTTHSVSLGRIEWSREDDMARRGIYLLSSKGLRPSTMDDNDTTPATADKGDGLYIESRSWPNPFHGTTRCVIRSLADVHVEGAIFDLRGRRIRTLVDETMRAGNLEIAWDGRNDANAAVAAGTYVLEVVAGSARTTEKIIYLK